MPSGIGLLSSIPGTNVQQYLVYKDSQRFPLSSLPVFGSRTLDHPANSLTSTITHIGESSFSFLFFPSNIFPTLDIETISEKYVEWVLSQYRILMLEIVKKFWYQIFILFQYHSSISNQYQFLILGFHIGSISVSNIGTASIS